MELLIEPEAPPLNKCDDGMIRVAGTRLTLDTLLANYKRGLTAEELTFCFPGVDFADIHSAISYYLKHREEVEEYLRTNEELEAAALDRIGRQNPTKEIRERLQSRYAQLKKF